MLNTQLIGVLDLIPLFIDLGLLRRNRNLFRLEIQISMVFKGYLLTQVEFSTCTGDFSQAFNDT